MFKGRPESKRSMASLSQLPTQEDALSWVMSVFNINFHIIYTFVCKIIPMLRKQGNLN